MDIQDYVHQPTHELRQSIINSGHQEIEGLRKRQFVIVPNFRTFTPSYSRNSARLIIVSKGATTIKVSKVSLLNIETGYMENIEINPHIEISKSVSDTGCFLGFVKLLNESFKSYAKFNQAKELELTITYSNSHGKQSTEKMLLKLVTKKEATWAT